MILYDKNNNTDKSKHYYIISLLHFQLFKLHSVFYAYLLWNLFSL